jgi:hypothetical protein
LASILAFNPSDGIDRLDFGASDNFGRIGHLQSDPAQIWRLAPTALEP